MTKKFEIRQIKNDDFSALLKLWERTNLDLAEFGREKKEFEMMIKLNPDTCLVIIIGDKIIASALGIFNGRRGMVYHLAVDVSYQRKGHGSILIKEVEKRLRAKGATRMNLFVSTANLRTIPFYEKNGYMVSSDSMLLIKDLWKNRGDQESVLNYDSLLYIK